MVNQEPGFEGKKPAEPYAIVESTFSEVSTSVY